MKSKYAISVYSEIGKLKTVLLYHRDEELLNLTPNLLERLLFNNTPDLSVAQVKHDQFAKILMKNDVEGLYIEKLAIEVISQNEKIRFYLINKLLKELKIEKKYIISLEKYLIQLPDWQLINKMIAAVTKFELGIKNDHQYLLVIAPLPNLLFVRNPFVSIGNGIIVSHIYSETRSKETLFIDLILNHPPRFRGQINFWYNYSNKNTIEGGDILVLNNKNIIIGVSQRTSIETIKYCATKRVTVLDLKTKNDAFIDLDTVFTNIDYDKFIIHVLIFAINDQFHICEITKNSQKQVKQKLKDYLSFIFNKSITFIKCGGQEAREQWNDGNNILTIAPGIVIVYDRNHTTIHKLKEFNIKVYQIASSELSRGSGGSHCVCVNANLKRRYLDLKGRECVMAINLKGRNFICLLDFTREEIYYLLELSATLKIAKQKRTEKQPLKGYSIALLYQKDSTCTRSAFEVAAYDLGMYSTYFGPTSSQIAVKESISDTAKIFGKIYNGIQFRGYKQIDIEDLAQNAGVPVWNALTDLYHPTQMLADIMTIQECKKIKDVKGIKFVYFGDARFNMANSYMIISAKLGMNLVICSAKNLWPYPQLLKQCQDIAQETGGSITLTVDYKIASKDADVVATDVWVSMGGDKNLWKQRIKDLMPYQVNKEKMKIAKPNAIFLHCLPSFHDARTQVAQEIIKEYGGTGELEVSDEVFQSSASKVFQQSENRLHTIKAVMLATLK